MKVQNSRFILVLVVLLNLNQGGALAASPAEKQVRPGSASASDIPRELALLENRFFFHAYGHDPLEKRIERIELLILGSGQIGSVLERVESLKKAVAARDSESAKVVREAKKTDSSASYPVVGSLEWRVLKKTYPQESLDQRLSRLESQLFGVPATAMSYVDRIERLKKTTGLGVALEPEAPLPRSKMGPPPRTSRGLPTPVVPFQDSDEDGLKFFKNGNSFGWTYRGGNMPPGMLSPFSGGAITAPSVEPRGLSDLMDDMNRQMTEMLKRFGSSDDYFPNLPGPNFREPGGQHPDFRQGMPILPPHPQPPDLERNFKSPSKEEIPPYSDPNSI